MSAGTFGGETASKDDTGYYGGPFRWPKDQKVVTEVEVLFLLVRPGGKILNGEVVGECSACKYMGQTRYAR